MALQEVVQGPPSPWKLAEKPKDTHMTLSRSHNGEQIEVDIMVNDQVCFSSADARVSRHSIWQPELKAVVISCIVLLLWL